MSYEESLRQITVQSIRYRQKEAVKAGMGVMMVELEELDILIGDPVVSPDLAGITEELDFIPPDPMAVTQALPSVTDQRTQPCRSLQ